MSAVLFNEPDRTRADLHFVLFGFPVRVHPMFWLAALLLGGRLNGSPTVNLIWVAAVFLSILAHELGHATLQRLNGLRPHIVLYWLGGLASADSRYLTPLRQLIISLAGPLSGFALTAIIFLIVVLAGQGEHIWFLTLGPVPILPVVVSIGHPLLQTWINDMSQIGVFWGVINLLPVFPLDGGQATRALLMLLGLRDSTRWSLQLSVLTAVIVAVCAAVYLHDFYLGLFFGFLAYSSYMALQFYGGPGR
jgi:stage IV sporulation protein FB